MESGQQAILLKVAHVLNSLGIPYHVGGSIACSIHGIPRFTQDIDLVASVRSEHIESLVNALEDEFYVDAAMIQEAIERVSSFNIIDLDSLSKVDIFVRSTDPRAEVEAGRRLLQKLDPDNERSAIYVSSPEDTILRKLEWFRLGGGISDRQWLDVIGVLKVQAGALDLAYLQHWSEKIGIADLLERAIAAARSEQ
jgi:hypothetical protein